MRSDLLVRHLLPSCLLITLTACGDDDSLRAGDISGAGSNNTGGMYYPPYAQNNAGGEFEPSDDLEPAAENDFIDTSVEATSTFSIDVDNASYTNARAAINGGSLPAADTVRVEDFINFFQYDYPQPAGAHPFSVSMEIAPSPFGQDKHLLRIGLKGREVSREQMKPASLVFLIDVSGSMQGEKLAMVKAGLNTLVDNMRPQDKIGVVVYAGADGVVLPMSGAQDKAAIKRAISRLGAGGSTNAEAGIITAYQMLEQVKQQDGNNRVILLTDGDFNVGRTGQALVDLIASYRAKHLSLTCIGVGRGGYNDYQMEELAREGNGNYFYLDSSAEAQRIFGRDLASTIEVIAADVKVQVGFNAEAVARYRLVGYDNRVLNNEDFEDDAKDAGEIGPGHDVTALYELELKPEAAGEAMLSEVRLRYKSQYGADSIELKQPIKMSQVKPDLDAATGDMRFVAAVAELAEILRGSKHSEGARFDDILALIRSSGSALDAERAELIQLIEALKPRWSR